MYLFSVLTMKHLGIPEEVFEMLLMKFLNEGIKEWNPYYVVKEMGKNGDHPHYNVVEKTNQRSDNRRKQFQNWYKKNDWFYSKPTIKTSQVCDLISLIGEYLEKEETRVCLGEKGFLNDELIEKIEERKKAMPYPSRINKKVITYEQAPNVILEAMKFLTTNEKPQLDRRTFAQAIKYLDRNNYEMKQIFNNISHIYIRIWNILDDENEEEDKDDILMIWINHKLDKDIAYQAE